MARLPLSLLPCPCPSPPPMLVPTSLLLPPPATCLPPVICLHWLLAYPPTCLPAVCLSSASCPIPHYLPLCSSLPPPSHFCGVPSSRAASGTSHTLARQKQQQFWARLGTWLRVNTRAGAEDKEGQVVQSLPHFSQATHHRSFSLAPPIIWSPQHAPPTLGLPHTSLHCLVSPAFPPQVHPLL